MLYAKNGRQMNLAAKALSKHLEGEGIHLGHQAAMHAVAKLLGFSSIGAATEALDGQKRGVAASVKSWRDLAHALGTLTDSQLDMSITVSEGCDENGNAEFFPAYELLLAGDDRLLAASDGVLENLQPVLIFNGAEPDSAPIPGHLGVTFQQEFQSGDKTATAAILALDTGVVDLLDEHSIDLSLVRHPDVKTTVWMAGESQGLPVYWDNQRCCPVVHLENLKETGWAKKVEEENWLRLAAQLELQGNEPNFVAGLLEAAKLQGLSPEGASVELSQRLGAYFSVGPLVAFSHTEKGYFNTNFGWIPASKGATGFFGRPYLPNGPKDLFMVPYFEAIPVGN
jgi:hypothetical protein